MDFQDLWTGRQKPPPGERGYLFMVTAFNRIGRHIHGDKWHDDFACKQYRTVSQTPDKASYEERWAAHSYLQDKFSDTYQPDWEQPPPVGLGGFILSAPRKPGYWFTPEDWQRYRKSILDLNSEMKVEIEMAALAADWLIDRVLSGEITPQLKDKVRGGDWIPCRPSDWRMPHDNPRWARIRNCSMEAGQPASFSGPHWIFIKQDELDAALGADADHERGEVRSANEPTASKTEAVGVAEIGFIDKGSHEARTIRDNEVHQPGGVEELLSVDEAGHDLPKARLPAAKGKTLQALRALTALFPDGIEGVAERDRLVAVQTWLKPKQITIGSRLVCDAATLYRTGARAS